MTTRPSHATLVEEVAKAIARVWSSENKNADLDQAAILFTPSAEATIASVAARLSDVTPEMVEAAQEALQKHINAIPISERRKTADPGGYVLVSIADKHAIRWRAMLAASPLTPGEKGEG